MERTTDVVVVGAGHSGLAMSRCLAGRGIDHVVLERGVIANAWRRERWDSLCTLTPNWQNGLPGYGYLGDDQDGFMRAREVADFIDGYARFVGAPVRTGTKVASVAAANGQGFRIATDRGGWRCRAVVLASGAHEIPVVPAIGAELPRDAHALTAKDYRNPDGVDDGVLVVGASATGLQIADELARNGRRVTLAVGEHIRLPRTYRGRDIQYWLDAIGVLDERYDEVDDIVRARRVPSPQLAGTRERRTLDLNALSERGVAIVGRLVGVREGRAQFSGSLRNHCAMADIKLARLLGRIDAWIERSGNGLATGESKRFAPTRVDEAPLLELSFRRERIGSVIWATGFRPDHSWLQLPAFDRAGRLRHDGGVVAVPGVYALGLNFMRRRKSSFLHGCADDVRDLGAHLHAFLRAGTRPGSLRVAGRIPAGAGSP